MNYVYSFDYIILHIETCVINKESMLTCAYIHICLCLYKNKHKDAVNKTGGR